MKSKKWIKSVIVLFSAAAMLVPLSGCGEDLPPEETQVIRITITPKPIVTLTPTPVPGEDPNQRTGSVTLTNDHTKTEETSGERTNEDVPDEANPTPTPAEDENDSEDKLPEGARGSYYGRDIYGNYITYDEYGLYVYDVNGNLVSGDSGSGSTETGNYGTSDYGTGNYGTGNYGGYSYGGYSYGGYGY